MLYWENSLCPRPQTVWKKSSIPLSHTSFYSISTNFCTWCNIFTKRHIEISMFLHGGLVIENWAWHLKTRMSSSTTKHQAMKGEYQSPYKGGISVTLSYINVLLVWQSRSLPLFGACASAVNACLRMSTAALHSYTFTRPLQRETGLTAYKKQIWAQHLKWKHNKPKHFQKVINQDGQAKYYKVGSQKS